MQGSQVLAPQVTPQLQALTGSSPSLSTVPLMHRELSGYEFHPDNPKSKQDQQLCPLPAVLG